MNFVDVLIPFLPGLVITLAPQILVPKTMSAEQATKTKGKLRKIGYVLLGVSLLYFLLIVFKPKQ